MIKTNLAAGPAWLRPASHTGLVPQLSLPAESSKTAACLLAVLCGALGLGMNAWAAEVTIITFDGLAEGTVVGSQYFNQGLQFLDGAYNQPVVRLIPTRPGYAPNAVGDISVGSGEFPPIISRGEFVTARATIGMNVGYLGSLLGGGTAQMTLKAYDPYGKLIGQGGPVTVRQGAGVNTYLEVRDPFANIVAFTIAGASGGDEGKPLAIDSITFENASGYTDFSLWTDPTVTFRPGTSHAIRIHVNRYNGSYGPIESFQVSGLPPGVSGTFSAASIDNAEDITLTLTVAAWAEVNLANPPTVAVSAYPAGSGNAGWDKRSVYFKLVIRNDLTVIDFQNLAAGTVVQNQYADRGLRFANNPGVGNLPVLKRVGISGHDVEPTNNVGDISYGSGEFPPATAQGLFDKARQHLSMRVGYIGAYGATDTAQMTLYAYDANNALAGQSGPVTVRQGAGFDTVLEVDSYQANIVSFIVRGRPSDDGGKYLAIDDVSFDTPHQVTPDFALDLPVSTTLIAGGSSQPQINIRRLNGSTGGIQFSAPADLPGYLSASFWPNPAYGDSCTLTLQATDWAATGTDPYLLTITATPTSASAGPGPRTATLPVYIHKAFELAWNNPPAGIIPRNATHIRLAVSRDANFAGPVSLQIVSLEHYVQGTLDPTVVDFHDGGLTDYSTLTLLASESAPVFMSKVLLAIQATAPGAAAQWLTLELAFEDPQLYGFYPQEGQTPQFLQPGTLVTVTGAGLSLGKAIFFGNDQAVTLPLDVSDDATTVHVRVPRLATSGPLMLKGSGLDTWSLSPQPFVVHSFRNSRGYAFQNTKDFGDAVGAWKFSDLEELFGCGQTHLPLCGCHDFCRDPDAMFLLDEVINNYLVGAQCFGFCLSGYRLFHNDKSYWDFPWQAGAIAPTVWSLQGPENAGGADPRLAHYIHVQHLGQVSAEFLNKVLDSIAWNRQNGNPRAISNLLAQSFASQDAPLVCVLNGKTGHTVAAYDLEPGAGPDDFYIDIYNPNRPFYVEENSDGPRHRDQEQASRIHITAQQWSLPMGTLWTGPFGYMAIVSPRDLPVQPTLPTGVNALKLINRAINMLIFSGSADTAQISDRQGRTMFTPDGQLNIDPSTAIPDAAVFAPLGALTESSASFYLLGSPGSETYTHLVRGAAEGTYSLTVLGVNYTARLRDVPTAANVHDTITLHNDAAQMRISRGPGRAPQPYRMELTARTEAGLVRKAILTLPALGDSQDSLEIDAARQAVLFRHTGAGTTCQLSLSQPDAQGNEQFFASPEVPVSNLDTLAFSPQDWAGLATAPVTLTRTDSQGNQTQQTFSSFQTTVSWFEGECQLQVHGHAGMWCRIEWSSDLAAWYPLTTLANVTGLAQYFDPESRNLPQRFYRITEMPPPVAQEKLIWGTWTWDIDANSDQVSADSDLFWEMATATERYLVPMNGAAIALLYGASFDALTPDVLRAASYSTEAVSASDNNPVLDVGTVLAVRTTAGAYAKLQVIGFEPAGLKYNIRFAYVLFR